MPVQYFDYDPDEQTGRRLERKWLLALKVTIIAILPFLCIFISLFIGRYEISFSEVVGSLFPFLGIPVDAEPWSLVIRSRLPRALGAAAVGGALAISGAAFQGVFRNPLVNPGLLGVSNGAGFGAALAIIAFGGGLMIYPTAFGFGLLAVGLTYWVALVYRRTPTIMLVLGGVIVSSVFSALLSLLKYLADPYNQLPDIVFWLMGSLSKIGFEDFTALVPILIGVTILVLTSWRIDALSMGDKEARSLGVDVNTSRIVIIVGATLATAGAIALSGVIGWVGLVIPHIGRMLVGSSNRLLLPCSFALGAGFLVIVDTVARSLTPGEVPLGILTALIGAPFFIYLLKRTKGGNWR